MTTYQRLTASLRQSLELFAFFHLGSDARIDVNESESGVEISVAHSRVVPFDLSLCWAEVEDLVADPARFEALMLDQLTRYRRS
ncbi:MAG: hypothetical protein EHM61_16150 [Acidobacteria bacterium]|nr:MAG: hypothetical protein EHM61_16150 [Acidobacteriota bacterium]